MRVRTGGQRCGAMLWAISRAQKGRKGKRRRAHQSQSAMPAHAMAENANAVRIHLFEIVKDSLWQFRSDVAVHFVALVPGRFCRVNVEARAASKIIGVVFALDIQASWNPIRHHLRPHERLPAAPYVGSCPGRARRCPSRSLHAGRNLFLPHCPPCMSNRPGILRGGLCGGDWWWFEGGGRG